MWLDNPGANIYCPWVVCDSLGNTGVNGSIVPELCVAGATMVLVPTVLELHVTGVTKGSVPTAPELCVAG